MGCFGDIYEFGELLVKLWNPGLLVVPLELILKSSRVFLVDPLVLEILGHIVYHKVLSLLSKPNVSLIADNLGFNLLDTVFAGFVVVDEVASNPSVEFYLGLAKSGNTSRPVPSGVKRIWTSWGLIVAVKA